MLKFLALTNVNTVTCCEILREDAGNVYRQQIVGTSTRQWCDKKVSDSSAYFDSFLEARDFLLIKNQSWIEFSSECGLVSVARDLLVVRDAIFSLTANSIN